MQYSLQGPIRRVVPPPIAEVQEWIAGREFPPHLPLLDVSQAVPGYPPDSRLIAHLQDRATVATTHFYTDILGRTRLRKALAGDIESTYNAAIPWQSIAITAGCNQAFCLCLDALAGAGDEVILIVPFYFNHDMWLRMRQVTPRYLPADRRTMLPDPAGAADLINDKTRAIVLVSPNNPTGAVYPPDLLKVFFELARRHGLALIVDETYRDFTGSANPPHALFEEPDWSDTLIHLYSFSKAFALTGHRVGALAGSLGLIEAVAKIMDCAIICAPHLGQEAALFGLEHLQKWRSEKSDLMRHRVAALDEAFAGNATRWKLVSKGAYFAYLEHAETNSSREIARQLAIDSHILSLPGSAFGPEQDSFVRFAFANLEATQIPELVRRLS